MRATQAIVTGLVTLSLAACNTPAADTKTKQGALLGALAGAVAGAAAGGKDHREGGALIGAAAGAIAAPT